MKKHHQKRVIGRITLALFALILGVSGARLSQALTAPTVFYLPGGYAWLRWNDRIGANGAAALDASMTGAGNIDYGFEEVTPWPTSSLPQPPDYPTGPGQLNSGDWVHSYSGVTTSSALAAALADHTAAARRLTLPVFSHAVGSGNEGAYRIDQLDQFIIIGRGGAEAMSYLDLVALADTRPICATGPSGLWGRVAFEPQWPYRPPTGPCEPRLEPATYTFPADAFIPINGLVYPNVGEAGITLITNPGTSFTVPIAMVNGQMLYHFRTIPAGTYELRARIWYKDPRDQISTSPRPYSLISVNHSDPAGTILVTMPQSSSTYQQDFLLQLYGQICAHLGD